MTFSISGKTAIVTGAANGIGLAIARQFIDQGANVMFADMDEDRLEEEVGEEAANEGPVRFFGGDLRQKLTIANLVSATIDAFDRVDILVNASRQMVQSDPLNVEDDGVELLLQQNLLTGLRLSQAVAKRMITQGKQSEDTTVPLGSIINLSSVAARLTRPELLAYSISSAAIEQMTRSMAVALAPERIRVNAVAFASVMSHSLKTALRDHADYRATIAAGTPLHRIAAPSEICDAVQFLASEGAAFMTGHVMMVDGGRSLLDPVACPAH